MWNETRTHRRDRLQGIQNLQFIWIYLNSKLNGNSLVKTKIEPIGAECVGFVPLSVFADDCANGRRSLDLQSQTERRKSAQVAGALWAVWVSRVRSRKKYHNLLILPTAKDERGTSLFTLNALESENLNFFQFAFFAVLKSNFEVWRHLHKKMIEDAPRSSSRISYRAGRIFPIKEFQLGIRFLLKFHWNFSS